MGATTAIAWANATFNPWIGCTKVNTACANCYAEREWATRRGRVTWGANGTRSLTTTWGDPLRWNAVAKANGIRPRVFCASLADVFEDWDGPMLDAHGKLLEVCEGCGEQLAGGEGGACHECETRPLTMVDVRRRLFDLIDSTPHIDWLLLTKRPENVPGMWGDIHISPTIIQHGAMRKNVWLGTSMADQPTAEAALPHLFALREYSPVLFCSIEPLVDRLELGLAITRSCVSRRSPHHGLLASRLDDWIDWVIVGGESGPKARPMNPFWARQLQRECDAGGVPFFFKQWGEWANADDCVGGDWPVKVWPDGAISVRVGKKRAGELLDGKLYQQIPEVS